MKKYFLFILVLPHFLSAIAGTGNTTAIQPAPVSPDKNILYTPEANYPHTEFEVNYCSIPVNSSGRQHSLQGFIASADALYSSFRNNAGLHYQSLPHISSKQYLDHIYPSHNFW